MTSEQIDKAFDRYIELFKAKFYIPEQFPSDGVEPSLLQAIQHCYWMSLTAKEFSKEHPAKAMRWLCFIQGTLWAIYGCTIDEFKSDKR